MMKKIKMEIYTKCTCIKCQRIYFKYDKPLTFPHAVITL